MTDLPPEVQAAITELNGGGPMLDNLIAQFLAARERITELERGHESLKQDLSDAGDRISELKDALLLLAVAHESTLAGEEDDEERAITGFFERGLLQSHEISADQCEARLTPEGLLWLREVRADVPYQRALADRSPCGCEYFKPAAAALPIEDAESRLKRSCDKCGATWNTSTRECPICEQPREDDEPQRPSVDAELHRTRLGGYGVCMGTHSCFGYREFLAAALPIEGEQKIEAAARAVLACAEFDDLGGHWRFEGKPLADPDGVADDALRALHDLLIVEEAVPDAVLAGTCECDLGECTCRPVERPVEGEARIEETIADKIKVGDELFESGVGFQVVTEVIEQHKNPNREPFLIRCADAGEHYDYDEPVLRRVPVEREHEVTPADVERAAKAAWEAERSMVHTGRVQWDDLIRSSRNYRRLAMRRALLAAARGISTDQPGTVIPAEACNACGTPLICPACASQPTEADRQQIADAEAEVEGP